MRGWVFAGIVDRVARQPRRLSPHELSEFPQPTYAGMLDDLRESAATVVPNASSVIRQISAKEMTQ